MSKRNTIVLAVLNAVLLVFILAYERGTLSTTETAGRSNQVLRSFIRDRVERVELEQSDGSSIVFVREREEDPIEGMDLGVWTIAEPIAIAADDDAVDGLLSALEWLGQHRVIDDVSASDREQFGLDEPRFVVRFTVIEEPYELHIGGTAPTGEGIYAEVVGEGRVYVVGDDIVESLDHDLAHFRSKELFDGFYPTSVQQVQLDDLDFVREDRVWRARSPERGWANQGVVDPLVRLPRELHATRFVAETLDDAATYGLDSPWRELTVTRADDVEENRVAHLRIGDACGEHDAERYAVAGDEGPVACVLVSDLDALTPDREHLREPRLLAVPDNAIERIVVERGEERLELRREDDRWKLFTGPEDDVGTPTLADDGAVTAWLSSLRDARVSAFESVTEEDLAHGLDEPTARILVERQGDDPNVEIFVGELDAVGIWVRRGDEAALARFPADVQDAVLLNALRFRARQVFEAEAADASRVVSRRGGTEERAVRGQGGTWALEAPVEVDADRVVIREFTRQLADLRAERYVASSATSEHGLRSPNATVTGTFTPEGEEETVVTLEIGSEAEAGGSYARLAGDDAVFLLAEDRVAVLTRALASLDLLTVDAGGLESLRIERGSEVTELTSDAGTWHTADGGIPHAARTRSLMDRLGTLRAIGVASYGGDFGPVAMRIVATRRPTVEGERTVTLELGELRGQGDEAYLPMRREGVGVVYQLRPDTVRALVDFAP